MAVQFHFAEEKAADAILFLTNLGLPGLTKYKLCKLVVLADKHHLVRFGRPVTGDRICAMEYGPVPSSTLTMLNNLIAGTPTSEEETRLSVSIDIDRRYYYPRLVSRCGQQQFQSDALSVSDIESLHAVADAHGKKSFDELKALTHEMAAYRKAWENRVNNAPDIAFEDFFEEEEEALAGAFEEMIETDGLRKVFGVAF